jgi:anti-anti-sigma factor
MTDTTTSDARYAHENGTWFIRLSGDLRHPLGPALNTLLDRAFAAPDTTQFLVDLADAETIDSTCLGILARIANWAGEKAAPRPIIITASEDITETLLAIRFDRLFELRHSSIRQPENLRDVAPQSTDREQMSEMVLEAHRRLCAIDDQNKAVFQSLVEALERETGTRRTE